jgi:hypothetical protein
MSSLFKTITAGALLAISLVFAQAVYAQQSAPADQGNSSMGTGMQNGGMMGMGNMMQQMTKMMETCNTMMESHHQNSESSPKK